MGRAAIRPLTDAARKSSARIRASCQGERMTTPTAAAPCDFGRHQRGGTCDCLTCGWHVWDVEPIRDSQGRIVLDGRECLQGRPRADRYGS